MRHMCSLRLLGFGRWLPVGAGLLAALLAALLALPPGPALGAEPAAASPVAAMATDDANWLVRVRALAFLTDTDGTTDALGGRARTSNAYVPELDFSYFFTPHIAAELILATTKHSVEVKGSTAGDLDLGTVWALPPVLTLQYHFTPKSDFRPYLGAGVNYTIWYNKTNGRSVTNVKYSNEFGWALQAGFDYMLDKAWSVNVDVKKVWVDTDITVNGGTINAKGTDIDPLAVSLGLGYRF